MLALQDFATLLDHRRRRLGMSHADVAARCGLSLVTVKRILAGSSPDSSFASVTAVGRALGVEFEVRAEDPDSMREKQARARAETVVRWLQGTSALEAQGLDADALRRMTERTYHELLAGPRRRLWAK